VNISRCSGRLSFFLSTPLRRRASLDALETLAAVWVAHAAVLLVKFPAELRAYALVADCCSLRLVLPDTAGFPSVQFPSASPFLLL
jgi:hypothetical protein